MEHMRTGFNFKKVGFFLISLATCVLTTQAKVTVSGVFGDNMVLQREMPVPVWGKAVPGEKVTVRFAGQEKTAVTDADGNWMLKLDSMKAESKGAELSVSGENALTFKNVVVGEVWLCSGQSNMAVTFSDFKREIKEANCPAIRQIKMRTIATATPFEVTVKWEECSPGTVGGFSAVAYYFARDLYEKLNIPIGLINSSWGGTRIEAWTAPEGFRLIPELKDLAAVVDRWDPSTASGKKSFSDYISASREWADIAEANLKAGTKPPPLPVAPVPGKGSQEYTVIYNGMIASLIPYAIRGAIWYQGEANGYESGLSYFHKMKALIGGWRQLWGQGDFSFYFVQLANYCPDKKLAQGGDGWANIRDSQKKSLEIPNTGMAVAIDIGDAQNIHPANKQDVGIRLARWALARDYGKDIVPSGPLYKGIKVEGNKLRISFDYVGGGLIVGKKDGLEPVKELKDGRLNRFAIAGNDKIWFWADAVIDGNTVLLSSASVPSPVAVRYAFSMNPEGANLYNTEGLPASPFRSDDW